MICLPELKILPRAKTYSENCLKHFYLIDDCCVCAFAVFINLCGGMFVMLILTIILIHCVPCSALEVGCTHCTVVPLSLFQYMYCVASPQCTVVPLSLFQYMYCVTSPQCTVVPLSLFQEYCQSKYCGAGAWDHNIWNYHTGLHTNCSQFIYY